VSKTVLEMKGVKKTYGEGKQAVHALAGVNLTAQAGELLMIMGPSGSGKTTLLSVIAGTLHFDEGDVTLLEHHLGKMSEEEVTDFRRAHVGFIFQQFHLIKALRSDENVCVPLLLNGESWKTALKHSKVALAQVGLEGREHSTPRQLSGGQQQRVAIARAIVHHPEVVICDEPTSNLDAETGGHVMELLSSLAKDKNRTIIVVTHDNRILPFADRIVKMDDGKITGVLTNGNDS